MKHIFTLGCAAFALIIGSSSLTQAGVISAHQNDSAPITKPLLIAIQANDEVIQGAENFITSVSGRGLKFLKDENLSDSGRKKEFRSLLKDSFDLKTIARFAMGRHWKNATDAQKKEYLSLFEDMVIDTYSSRFGEYQGQEISILKARAEGKKDAIVNSQIISNNGSPAVRLDWRVRYKNGEYRVVDILVEGVSMTLTQRSEFSSIIQRGGGSVEALLIKLRER